MSQTAKIIIVVLVLLVLGFLGYYFFVSSTSTPEIVETGGTVSASSAGQDILDAASKLQNVVIDPAIFSSDIFTHLQDFGQATIPEQHGRPNPFAPIGVGTR